MNRETIEKIDSCLNDPDTPTWGRVILIVLRDNHRELFRHLAWHDACSKRTLAIVTPVSVAVIIGIVWAIIQLL